MEFGVKMSASENKMMSGTVRGLILLMTRLVYQISTGSSSRMETVFQIYQRQKQNKKDFKSSSAWGAKMTSK